MIFRNTPIKRKFTLVILLTSGMALLIAYLAFVAVELHASRNSMVHDFNVLAHVVGINTTAALSFNNPNDAQETLESLSAEPQILSAAVFDEKGDLFASYSKGPGNESQNAPALDAFLKLSGGSPDEAAPLLHERHIFEGNRLLICRPIVLNEKRIGSICLTASLRELFLRIRLYAGIALLSLVASLIAAFALSSSLRRTVTDPVLGLASTARQIAEEGNYSLRAVKQSSDEIGNLADDFNEMLAVIEERNNALQKGTLELKSQIAARLEAEEKLKALNEGLEQRVQERTQELTRSNQELEQFAYVASHDLQEPLRIVASYVQLIESRYKDQLDADGVKFINFAVDGAKRMQQLIQGLLAYCRVGAHEKDFQPTDCEQLLKVTITDLKFITEKHDAVITYSDLPTVLADRIQLAQLFQNLLSNALKFHGEEPPRIHVSAQRSDGYWTFSVKDNGIGIDPTFFDRIFVIFQRLHGRTKYPGTGIGLAVCKKIVERHGGKIWVESDPGRGATFFFTIPALADGKAGADASQG